MKELLKKVKIESGILKINNITFHTIYGQQPIYLC